MSYRSVKLMFWAVIFVFTMVITVFASQFSPEVENWLQEHKIGPHQEDEVDYDELYQLALERGETKVVVYASSSRGPASLAEGFYDKYPEIEVEWNTLGTADSLERFMREQAAGIYNVDIMFCSDMGMQVTVLYPEGMIFPWVPPDLIAVIRPAQREPLLGHRLEARTILYNDHVYKEPPIESWWDLTKPEWEGKFVLVDPRSDSSVLDLFQAFVFHSEEMAAEYERVFGEPIELTTPTAGHEFIKRLAKNNPRFVSGDKDARWVAEKGLEDPPLAVGMTFGRIREAGDPEMGYLGWTVPVNIKPRVGFAYPSGLNIAYGAPHPTAAKLVVRWLMGDEKGGGGMTPWFVPGNWPVRTDVENAPEHDFLGEGYSWALGELDFWYLEAEKYFLGKEELLKFVQDVFK